MPEGPPTLAAFADLDAGAWEPELHAVFARLDRELVPALLQMRSDPNVRVRRAALAQLTALGMTDPQLVLANGDPHLLARALSTRTSTRSTSRRCRASRA